MLVWGEYEGRSTQKDKKRGKIKSVRLQGVKKRERCLARNYTGKDNRRML